MTSYQKGREVERKAFRKQLVKMLGQVKRLAIHQSSQVMLQELIVWLDERSDKVTERAALELAEALQAECARQNLMRM